MQNKIFLTLNHSRLGLCLLGLLTLLALCPVTIPALVYALGSDWNQGFDHPMQGGDHLLTMIAVGVWAAQLRGRAIWLLPLTFVSVMSLGGLAGAAKFSVPNAEAMILLSCLVLSVLIVNQVQFNIRTNLLIIAVFAFFHGYAHGQEISASANLISYTLGFVCATLLLHGSGIVTACLVMLVCAIVFGNQAHAGEAATAVDTAKAAANTQPETQDKGAVQLKEIAVTEDGQVTDLIGIAASASQGDVSREQFEYRPFSRSGELVEVVPGLIATQHSGSGKANQFFLRGFNLDHGTDFITYVDGIPINLPSHAHGQGYLDLNSVIPELVNNIEYGKGPYYAELGDFAAAGYSKLFSVDKLPHALAKLTVGEFEYYRGLFADSLPVGRGNLLYAGEFNFYNGVWQQPEDSQKFNGQLSYTLNEDTWGVSVFAKSYTNTWTATNQIPKALIDNGTLDLYGTIDPSDGGKTNRHSFSTKLWNKGNNWKNDANIYAVYYDLDLYSNFTGFLNDPVNGDQIHQFEHRVQTGGNIEHTRFNKLLGFNMDNSFGLQLRHDEIMNVGLDRTVNRQFLSTVSRSNVGETSVGVYLKNQTYWHDKVRTIAGLRGDFINNDVAVLDTASHDPFINAANSGHRNQVLVSPKFSLALGPWDDTEYFINAGYGFHSNDARGTTLRFDPNSGAALNGSAARITPLASSRGAEIGLRSNFIQGLNTTLALWWLESSQELVFVGDEGTTEVNGKSVRYGVEWNNAYKPNDWLTLDADLALTSARFVDTPDGETGNLIPNSVGRVISAGATVVAPNGLFGSLRLRHFGDVPLDSSGVFNAGSTSIVNLGAGYRQKHYKMEIDVFNILGSTQNDIAYAYEYAFPAAASAQTGILKHPVEPRMVRATLTVNF